MNTPTILIVVTFAWKARVCSIDVTHYQSLETWTCWAYCCDCEILEIAEESLGSLHVSKAVIAKLF